ncbi:MAG: hypothetical protein B7X90_06445 [Novosphingobium sp. 17-62-19]|nr:MAG: hypothetical protein B7X90_06445 [Novosphingobium sp. 17-62-19]
MKWASSSLVSCVQMNRTLGFVILWLSSPSRHWCDRVVDNARGFRDFAFHKVKHRFCQGDNRMLERRVKTVRALERGLDVLIEVQTRKAASLHELHQATGLPKATLLRMLVTLGQKGLVWQRLADGAYLPHVDRVERALVTSTAHMPRSPHRI